jgi:hypothetical protein
MIIPSSNPTSVYVMRCKAKSAVLTPLVFVSRRKSYPQTFLFFELVSNNVRVTTNVRNDQRVGLHVECMRDNLSLCPEVHGYIRIPNLFQRDMYTSD